MTEAAPILKEFGTWLRERRRALDLTQEELADRVGCSPDTIRKIELGQRRPSRQVAELIAEGLGLPLDERSNVVRWARASYEADKAQLNNPYKGLQAFDEADAPFFFGREALTQRLLSRLSEPGRLCRFLAVIGPSGSGKSSVVQAGLIPSLRSNGLPAGDQIEIVSMLPGTSPLRELRIACARSPSPGSNSDASRLVFIDQFEELFTLTYDEAERTSFLAELYCIVTDLQSRIWVVVTLRADFYDRPLMYANASELFAERAEVVGPMSVQEMNRAITGPAERAGLTLETGLVEIIERDVGEQPGSLPLLEYALTELFDRRVGRTLSIQAYQESGGALCALSNRAEAIHSELTPSEQEEERQMFLRLVALGEEGEETRRRAPRSELASAARDEEALDRVLEICGRYRLLTFDRDPINGRPTVEVAHEALIRTWPRLRTWLEVNREILRLQRQLMAASTEWINSGKEPSFLAAGTRLARFEPLSVTQATTGDSTPIGVTLTVDEREYLLASIREREREQAEREQSRRRVTVSLVVGLMLMLILAGLAILQSIQANDQRNAAETQKNIAFSRELAAKSQAQLSINPNLALLLAIEAGKLSDTAEAQEALQRALIQTQPHTELRYPGGAKLTGAAFSPDGKEVATTSDASIIRVWEVNDSTGTSGNILTELVLTPRSGSDEHVVFSPDGSHLLVVSSDGNARLWDLKTQSKVQEFKSNANMNSANFSPDSKYVVTASGDELATIWDTFTGKKVIQLAGHDGPVHYAAFSPNGMLVVTASTDGIARIWDAHTGNQLRELTGHTDGLNSAVFSPDGKYVVTASDDDTARLWDVNSGQSIRVFLDHMGAVQSAAFSADGKYLVSAGADSSARVWDVYTGETLAMIPGSIIAPAMAIGVGQQPIGIVSAAFSPDGTRILLVTGGEDNAARIFRWELFAPLEHLLSLAPSLIQRQLTCDERQTYLHETTPCGKPSPTLIP